MTHISFIKRGTRRSEGSEVSSIVLHNHIFAATSSFAAPGRSETARFYRMDLTFCSLRGSLNPGCDVCAAAYTRLTHTQMRHANFTQSAIFKKKKKEPSTEAMHPGCGTHRRECKSSQILRFWSCSPPDATIGLGRQSQQSR